MPKSKQVNKVNKGKTLLAGFVESGPRRRGDVPGGVHITVSVCCLIKLKQFS